MDTTAFEVEKYEDRDEWLAARRSGLGGTDAAPILKPDISPWSSPYSIWCEKSGLAPPETGQTGPQMWGSILEPVVLARFAEEHGALVRYRNTLWRSKSHPWLVCSPDARLADEDELVEAKAPGAHQRDKWENGPPLLYQVQVHHQLAVCGWARCHVAVLLGGQDYRTYTIERDDRFVAAMLPVLGDWWQRHVVGRVAPAIDGSSPTSSVIASLYPTEAPGQRITLPPEALLHHRRRQRAADRIARWQTMLDAADNRLKALVGDAEVGVLPDGSGEYRWRSRRRDAHTVKASAWRQFEFKVKEGRR